MKPVPKTIGIQKPPHHHLRLCIFAFDLAHIVAAGIGIVYVGQNIAFSPPKQTYNAS